MPLSSAFWPHEMLLKRLTAVWVLEIPGDGEQDYVRNKLNALQKILGKFQEFGYEVKLLDEEVFPETSSRPSVFSSVAVFRTKSVVS
ncbi:MAG TPA: hypothetical protein VJJ27_00640 [Candidatus Paceibacterota bacterium]